MQDGAESARNGTRAIAFNADFQLKLLNARPEVWGSTAFRSAALDRAFVFAYEPDCQATTLVDALPGWSPADRLIELGSDTTKGRRSMVKKLILLASAIAAMAALVAPAAANATPVLKQGSNTVTVGTAITGTADNSGLRLFTETSLGTLECESIVLKGTVTKNNGSEIEGVGVAGSTTEGCSFEEIETANVKNIEITRLFTNTVEGETGVGTFEAAYESEIPGGAICKFSNKGKPGTFHYKTGEGHDTLEIRRTNVTSSGCGESFLQGTVTLETSAGPVHVD